MKYDKIFHINYIPFFFFILYMFSIGKDPILGDSLGFTVTAYKGFDLGTNATNHFLYINVLAILHKIFSTINPHFLFVIFSILCSVFTLHFLNKLLILFDISKNNIIIVMLFFGFSFTFFRISVITEVYAFYILFVTLFLLNIFKYNKFHLIPNFYFASVFFGCMFIIHIQSILLIPFYIYFLYKNRNIIAGKLYLGVLIPVLFFLVLLIPVFQGKNSFMAIFADNSYGKQFIHFELKTFVRSLVRNSTFLCYNFLYFLPLIFLGFKKISYKIYFLIAIIPYVVFTLKHDVSDSYVFHLVPYLFLLIILGKGLEKINHKLKYAMCFVLPLIYFTTFKIIDSTNFGKNINKEIGFKGGTKYFFFPPLTGNPGIEQFIQAYENDQLKEKKTFERQYNFALQWSEISKKYKVKK